MSSQSPLDRITTARVTRSGLLGLGIGALIGLILGLLIGWVWWPVEWQGSQAAVQTGAVKVSPELTANYMAAVADSFVASAGDPNAASLAAQRLTLLGGEVQSNFENAISYFAGQPGGQTQVQNLQTLALAVGQPVPGSAVAASQPPPAAATQAAAPAAAPSSQSGGVGGWLAVLLTALLLVAGGFFILYRLAQQRKTEEADEETSAFVDEDITPAAPHTSSGFQRGNLEPLPAAAAGYQANSQTNSQTNAQAPSPTAASPNRSASASPRPVQAAGALSFEPEEDDYENYPAVTFHPPVPDMEDEPVEPEVDEDDEVVVDNTAEFPLPPAARFATAVGASAPYTGAQPETPPPAPAAPPRQPAAYNPAVQARYERFTPIDSFTATYSVGMPDFDYTRNIGDPNGKDYLGEYGIGIADTNGTLDGDLERIVALQVYLFDKSDESQMTTVTRILLSEYAHDKLYDLFTRDKQGAPPVTAQPGLNLQLEGRNLLLDCTIADVRYASDGILKSMTANLAVKRKA